MELDGDKFENEINTNSGFNSKSIYDIESIDLKVFWDAFKAYISEIELDKGYLNNFNGRWTRTCDEDYWEIDRNKVARSMIQEMGKGEYPLKKPPENKIIKKLVEFFFKHVSMPENHDSSKARYNYTIRINELFDNFNLPLKLLKGRVTFKKSIILNNLLIHEDLTYLKNDSVLSELLKEAVTFFTDSQKINIDTALEKIANSLERVKTIFEGSDKKKSTEKTIELLSKDVEIRGFLDNHLKNLNLICNNYLIRHKEVN
ncbi:MAG: hypothetical protein NT166_17980 [Candidatus Aminicenantes bacterium]|nr:hypothetical protein [Candidatus Aminicenantes bacterium]